MISVDEKMQRCCLKHEIRRVLWEKYARAVVGNARPIKYLTLYSPAMMDIKYFERQGLIRYEKQRYVGVAAVTKDEEVYAAAIAAGAGRPEFLAMADLNDLLVRPSKRPKYSRRFRSMFPFDVLNLDYCNSLFCRGNRHEISLQVLALDTVIGLQKQAKAKKFALLLTTRADPGQVAQHFLDDLAKRIDTNLNRNPDFKGRYDSLYAGINGGSLLKQQYEEFVPLGLVKFVGNLVSSHGFELMDCETASLVRDGELPERWILHTAFLVALPRASLKSLGRQDYLERKVVRYLDRRIDGQLVRLAERTDSARLEGSIQPSLPNSLPLALNCVSPNLNNDDKKAGHQMFRFVLRRGGAF